MTVQKFKTVAEFMSSLDENKKSQVELLRNIIFSVHPNVTEHIKWNAPSYVLEGEDRVTFNLINKENVVKLIIHMGATQKEEKKAKPILSDDAGIVEWNSNIRGTLSFSSKEDIKFKAELVQTLLQKWLSIEY